MRVGNRDQAQGGELREWRQGLDRLGRDHKGRCDVALAYALQRRLQTQIDRVGLEVEGVQDLQAQHCRCAAFLAQTDRLAGEVRQALDLGARQKMELQRKQGSDVNELAADI